MLRYIEKKGQPEARAQIAGPQVKYICIKRLIIPALDSHGVPEMCAGMGPALSQILHPVDKRIPLPPHQAHPSAPQLQITEAALQEKLR